MVCLRVLLASFLLFSFVGLAGANFACGEVTFEGNFSSNWMKVDVYYESEPEDKTSCRVSGEGKFCCDLEEIKSVGWGPQKKVFARVFDSLSGHVSNRVSLVTSDEGYDVFRKMTISSVFDLDDELEDVYMGVESVNTSVELHPEFNNLDLLVNSSDASYEEEVCRNCTDADLAIPLYPGENNVSLRAFGEEEFEKVFSVYLLDRIDFEREFLCSKCYVKRGRQYVPSNSVVDVVLRANFSGHVKGEFLEYVPEKWTYFDEDDIVPFSVSHQAISFDVFADSFEARYKVKTPSDFFQRKYSFVHSFGDIGSEEKVFLSNPFWFWIPFYLDQKFENHSSHEMSLKQFVYPDRPYVVNFNNSGLNILAIYPKRKGVFKGIVRSKESLFSDRTEFEIVTNFREKDIDRLYVQFRVREDEEIELFQGDERVLLREYRQVGDIVYLSAYLESKDNFYLVRK